MNESLWKALRLPCCKSSSVLEHMRIPVPLKKPLALQKHAALQHISRGPPIDDFTVHKSALANVLI